MDSETIRAVHGYEQWATEKVLACCAQISQQDFVADREIPWGSIRNQLVHQIATHRSWLSWADGSLSGEEAYALSADPADYPDVAAIRALWEPVQKQTDDFLNRMIRDDLERILSVEWPGYEFKLPVGQIMLHIAHHSMQHRTETAVALTALNASPGDIDYLFYALEQQ